jgi:hypothetical protein
MSVGGGCLAANSASTRAGLAVVLLAAAACYLVAGVRDKAVAQGAKVPPYFSRVAC